MKKLLALLTLIPALSYAFNQAAYDEAKKKGPLAVGHEICALQRKVEQSIVNSVIPETEIDTATAQKLPRELVKLIGSYQLPTMDELYAAACASVGDCAYAQSRHCAYDDHHISDKYAVAYFDPQKKALFKSLGFDGFNKDEMLCTHCNTCALTPALSWMQFPFHNAVHKELKPSENCAVVRTKFGEQIPADPTMLRNYLLSHFYNYVGGLPEVFINSFFYPQAALWYLLIMSNRFEMGDRQYLEAAAATPQAK